jgi:hypothetical protein
MPRKTAVIEEPAVQATMEPEEAQDIVEDDELYEEEDIEEEDIEEDDDFDEDDLDDLEDEEFDEEAEFAEEDEHLREGNEPEGETDHAEGDNIAEFPEMRDEMEGDDDVEDECSDSEQSYVQNMMKDLNDAAFMTQTNFWRNHFYPNLKKVFTESREALLNADKTRDIVKHQETIKVVRNLIDLVESVVADFRREQNSSPLLAHEFEGKEAEFDRNLGMIIVR